MLSTYFYALTSVIIVSLLSLVGIFALLISPKTLKKIILFLVSLSAGTLLGDSFLHLIPEAIGDNKENLTIWLYVLAGILCFFILEKIIHWRHCHLPTNQEHPHPVGVMNLVGDGLHNFIDGVIIAGSFLISFKLGLATTLAVIAHEIPQEIGDFAILLYAGYSRAKAIILNFLSAILAIVGALITLIIGNWLENFSLFIIPFTAGGFIYIATADLLPELKKHARLGQTLIQLLAILLGMAIMLLLKKLS